jgi:hypothetical protein
MEQEPMYPVVVLPTTLPPWNVNIPTEAYKTVEMNASPMFHLHVSPADWERYHWWLRLAQSLPSNNILVRSGTDIVTVVDATSLKLQGWLVDSILHYFMNKLKRIFKIKISVLLIFFSSFFSTLLFNDGHANLEGTFSYRNVETWARKKLIPAKIPIN